MTASRDPGPVRRRVPARGRLARRRHAVHCAPCRSTPSARCSRSWSPTRGAAALQYGSGQGDPRAARADLRVMALEGIEAHPDDVVVTVGSQQALDLVTRIFIDPGDVVLAEAPSYVGALGDVRGPTRPRSCTSRWTTTGWCPTALREAIAALRPRGRAARSSSTRCPNFHNPAGVTLVAARGGPRCSRSASAPACSCSRTTRTACSASTATPLPALRARRPATGVIYLGSFSKTFAPGPAGRLGAGAARRTGEARARRPRRRCCARRRSPSSRSSDLPRAPSRGRSRSRCSGRCTASAATRCSTRSTSMMPAGTHLDPAGRRLLRLADAARGPRREGDAAARGAPRGWRTCPGTAFYADGSGARSLRLSYCYPSPTGSARASAGWPTSSSEELELRDDVRRRPSDRPDPPARRRTRVHARDRCRDAGPRSERRRPVARAGRRAVATSGRSRCAPGAGSCEALRAAGRRGRAARRRRRRCCRRSPPTRRTPCSSRCTAPPARTARCATCSTWPASRTSASDAARLPDGLRQADRQGAGHAPRAWPRRTRWRCRTRRSATSGAHAVLDAHRRPARPAAVREAGPGRLGARRLGRPRRGGAAGRDGGLLRVRRHRAGRAVRRRHRGRRVGGRHRRRARSRLPAVEIVPDGRRLRLRGALHRRARPSSSRRRGVDDAVAERAPRRPRRPRTRRSGLRDLSRTDLIVDADGTPVVPRGERRPRHDRDQSCCRWRLQRPGTTSARSACAFSSAPFHAASLPGCRRPHRSRTSTAGSSVAASRTSSRTTARAVTSSRASSGRWCSSSSSRSPSPRATTGRSGRRCSPRSPASPACSAAGRRPTGSAAAAGSPGPTASARSRSARSSSCPHCCRSSSAARRRTPPCSRSATPSCSPSSTSAPATASSRCCDGRSAAWSRSWRRSVACSRGRSPCCCCS